MSETPITDARWAEEWALHNDSGGRSSPAHGMETLCQKFELALQRRDILLREVLKRLRDDADFDLHVLIERELGDRP